MYQSTARLVLITGGNCELTKPGEKIVHNGVTIIGYTVRTSCPKHWLIAGSAISSPHTVEHTLLEQHHQGD